MIRVRRVAAIGAVAALVLGGAQCGGGGSAPQVKETPDSLFQMMRVRAAELKTLRQWLASGHVPEDSLRRLYHPFSFGEGAPTEGMHLSPMFPTYAEAFSKHYEAFYRSPSVRNYNLMVKTCEGCHREHCPGPLRLIGRLYLPEE